MRRLGEMAEWSKAAVLKTVNSRDRVRGFESHSLLQNTKKSAFQRSFFKPHYIRTLTRYTYAAAVAKFGEAA